MIARIFLTGFLCMVLSMSQLVAQVTLRGKVKDGHTGEIIPYVTISIPGTANGTQANFEGEFFLDIPSPLPCSLVFSFIGYKQEEMLVADTKYLNVFLQEDVVMLEGIQIVESKLPESEIRDPRTRVSYDRLDILSNPSIDIISGVGAQKDIDVSSPSLAFKILNTRGFNSTAPVRMLQLIDGVDNQSPGLNFSLGNFLGSSELDLLRVDVIVGASGPFYGPNAFNGVISMKTLDPFIHQGVSVMMRAGERNLLEGGLRYADAFRNKKGDEWLACKLNLFALKANDWEADNYDPVTASKVDASNPGRYNAVNIYGDEYSLDLTKLQGNQYLYPGLGHFFRTGYNEADLVDYDTYNYKASLAFQFRLKPLEGIASPELLLSTATSGGTTVFQGDNRFSLRDIRFFQHKLEWSKPDKFFLRGYFTHENSGRSYDPFFTSLRLQQMSKDNRTWYNDYIGYWQGEIIPRLPPDNRPSWIEEHPDSIRIWHAETAAYADTRNNRNPAWMKDKPIPGTEAFNTTFDDITRRLNNEDGGTRFYDRSALLHLQGEYIWTPGFVSEIRTGGNLRWYMPDSKGTIFHDTSGTRITNRELGWYIGMRKAFLKNQKLVLNGTLRLDKNENFKWIQTPALSLVYEPIKETFFRVSFSSALRNPTLVDQHMYLNVGPAILAGHLGQVDSLITLSSFEDYLNSLNADTLEYFNIAPLRPERVKVIECGVRSKIGSSLYVDAGYYRNSYRDFLGYLIGIKSDFEPPPLPLPINTWVFRYSANSDTRVSTEGFSAGLQYYVSEAITLRGNYSYNKLRKVDKEDPIIPAFNTPLHKYNVGISVTPFLRAKNSWSRNLSGAANFKWVEGYQFEGSPQFTGFIPSYGVVDAQVSYKLNRQNTTIKIGSSNLFNNKHYETYGGPKIGRMAYIQIRYDITSHH